MTWYVYPSCGYGLIKFYQYALSLITFFASTISSLQGTKSHPVEFWWSWEGVSLVVFVIFGSRQSATIMHDDQMIPYSFEVLHLFLENSLRVPLSIILVVGDVWMMNYALMEWLSIWPIPEKTSTSVFLLCIQTLSFWVLQNKWNK